jgi:hypothetical protein
MLQRVERSARALLLAMLLALNLVLPTLHALASRAPTAGEVAHQSQSCAQCEAFAHARTELAASPPVTLPATPPYATRDFGLRTVALGARLVPTSGSPRAPPTLLSLS